MVAAAVAAVAAAASSTAPIAEVAITHGLGNCTAAGKGAVLAVPAAAAVAHSLLASVAASEAVARASAAVSAIGKSMADLPAAVVESRAGVAWRSATVAAVGNAGDAVEAAMRTFVVPAGGMLLGSMTTSNTAGVSVTPSASAPTA